MPIIRNPPFAVPDDPKIMWSDSRVEVSERVLGLLRSVCDAVITDNGQLLEHGRDWWPRALRWVAFDNTVPARPSVIVRPSTTEQVAGVVRVCAEERIPVTAMGGRSGVCGAAVPVHGGVALDTTALRGIVAVDRESLLVRVAAGEPGDVFESALQTEHGLTLGHWPQSIALSTVGGWLACRSAGQYSTRYGKIEDLVMGLELVLADGQIVRTGGRAPREALGPDLTQLFVGSEGTFGVITEATLRVRPLPEHRTSVSYGFTRFEEGLDVCRRVLQRGATPAVLRLYDPTESTRNFATTAPTCVLVVHDEGDPALVDATMGLVDAECAARGSALGAGLVDTWFSRRNDVAALESLVGRGLVVDTIEVAGRWAVLGEIYQKVVAAVSAVPHTIAASCHQSHGYLDGACLYFTFAGGRKDAPPGWHDEYYRDVWEVAMGATLESGATISHHHGIGLLRGPLMAAALGPAYSVLVALKAALDPLGIMNPGKLGLPDPFALNASSP